MGQESTNHHRVTWTLEQDSLQAAFTCSAPPDAYCRCYCDLPGCDDEGGCRDGDEHDKTPGHACSVVEWLNLDANAPELYAGEPAKPIDGPIEEQWEGDCYLWVYAAPGSVSDAES